ncbi:MAG TPA: M48 family metallopeptidase [Cytophagaceae bacterium]|jgi:STE24 endopeptidase
MEAATVLNIIIGILIFDYVLDQTLSFLNLKSNSRALPTVLADIFEHDKYQKSLEYHRVNTWFGFITSTFSFLVTSTLLLTGAFGKLDFLLRVFISPGILLSLAFFGVIFLVSDLINMPFSLYKTFVIEEKFGFNKTNVKTFLLDKMKGYLLTIIVGGLLGSVFLYLVEVLGNNFWYWFWLIISAFLVFVNMFYASLILPLFNKLVPLEDGKLKQTIYTYSQKVGFPLHNIFVIDGSKRSSKANAFFSGLGPKKKIVLYDTLIKDQSTEELVAVLAHEVGHYKKKHIQVGMVLSILQTGLMLFILSRFVFNPVLSDSLGGINNAIHLNLIAFGLLFNPISTVIGIGMNMMSRKNEFEADEFAAKTFSGAPLIAALKKLSANNLSNLTPHPAYVFFNYSHPPLLKRLENLKRFI